MKFYLISLIGKNLAPLTYHSEIPLWQGQIVDVRLRGRSLKGAVVEEVSEPEFKTLEASASSFFVDSEGFEVARFISSYYFCALGEALRLFYPASKDAKSPEPIDIELVAKLSGEQKEALEFISSHSVSLLFGDTGSGKSEVYFHKISRVLSQGKTAILLMPEISLTPQMEDRLKANFGELVAIWHSKVTKKRKEKILEGIKEDKIKIVAGARSSLFLPLKNLGLIIIDEEHESSFKSQSKPRINAKDIAIYYASKVGAKVILGSATPSVKSYVRYPHFRLEGRYFDSKKRVFFDSGEGLTPFLLEEIEKRLKLGEQVLVFNPTRGDFKYTTCMECKESVKCPYCDVSMTLHTKRNLLECHYCSNTSRVISICPSCGEESMKTLRAGTSNIKEQLEEHFKDARIAKFDRDELTTEAKLKKTIKAFNQKEIDILVGTQMLSKGHDYHNVSLAIVLGIDYLLAGYEYNSRERAISLLVQVAGRSGRRYDGDVIIQSANEEFIKPYIQSYDSFLESEKSFRKELYPPYTRLCVLRFEDRSDIKARELMDRALSVLQREKVEIVGSGESGIKRLQNRYRYHILLRSHSANELHKAVKSIVGTKCEIDMDPEFLS
ncbi:MAG: primosomal protein N' [Campylobacterales bacterium]